MKTTVIILGMLLGLLTALNLQKGNFLAKRDCKINLLNIETAKLKCAVSGGLQLTNTISENQIFGALGMKPTCPEKGEYSIGATIGDLPSCSKHQNP